SRLNARGVERWAQAGVGMVCLENIEGEVFELWECLQHLNLHHGESRHQIKVTCNSKSSFLAAADDSGEVKPFMSLLLML
ncbi:hypothetical protein L195_g035723, partial [Trifolium pratense]